MKNKYIVLAIIVFLSSMVNQWMLAQVNIGSLEAPARAGLLQIKDRTGVNPAGDTRTVEKGGLILPRVLLVDLNELIPLVETSDGNYANEKVLHVGSIVYNVSENPAKQLRDGVYLWNGTSWVLMITESEDLASELLTPLEMIYPSGRAGEAITSQPVGIKWEPTSATASFSISKLLGDGVTVDPSTPLPTLLVGGTHTYNMLLAPMNPVDVVYSPFLENMSTLDITISDAGSIRKEKVIIRQRHYNLLVDNLNKTPLLGETHTASIRANTKWKASIVEGAEAVVSFTTSGAAGSIGGVPFVFTLKPEDIYEKTKVTFKFESVDDDGITVNNRIVPVEVSVITLQEYANSYIVAPGATFDFPIRKAYNVWNEEMGQPLPANGVEVELVWQDRQGMVSSLALKGGDQGINSRIEIVTTPGDPGFAENPEGNGNALVAVKVGGEIRWTWHIWITAYNPEQILSEEPGFSDPNDSGYATVPGGMIMGYNTGEVKTTFMDRHLGAKTYGYTLINPGTPAGNAGGSTETRVATGYGLIYQWGRMTPFLPQNTYYFQVARPSYDINNLPLTKWVATSVTESNMLISSIQKPLEFYTQVADNDNDWYSKDIDTENPYLWKKDNGEKGTYDPCPKGWVLPDAGAGLRHVMYGPRQGIASMPDSPYPYIYQFENAGFKLGNWVRSSTIIASGANYANSETYTWTRTPIGAQSYFNLYQTNIGLRAITFPRAYGMPVRCVREVK